MLRFVYCYAENHDTECYVVMLSVIILNIVMLSVIMLNIVMLSVTMPKVVMLSVGRGARRNLDAFLQ